NILYKSKSAVCDEINLVDALSERGIKSIETDTGQFIIKQNNEKAEHMVVPAIHKSKSDVFELLKNDFDFDAKSDVHQAVNFTSNLIKEKIKEGKVTISGANFLCADAGAIAITENEGNIFYSIGNAKAHIVLTGIDKMLPSINDLDLFLPLLSTFASGESLSSFNHIITAPQRGKELYLILLDNGRSNALSDKETRPVMSCIKCGACQNVCPVLRATGNIALSFEHGGPSGNLQNALKNNPKEQSHLFELSTLCGKCDTVCPVNINLHKLYLYGRKNHSDQNNGLSTGKLNMFLWKKSVAKRGAYNFASGKMRKVVVETYFKSGLKPYNLTLSEKSFNDMWREQMMLN
ncbi:MAG TPA: LUD domain-containing protein, partial [Bacteroidia bacterium]|nr:LUD domain-containing protein [Bacteroidia bacterium]